MHNLGNRRISSSPSYQRTDPKAKLKLLEKMYGEYRKLKTVYKKAGGIKGVRKLVDQSAKRSGSIDAFLKNLPGKNHPLFRLCNTHQTLRNMLRNDSLAVRQFKKKHASFFKDSKPGKVESRLRKFMQFAMSRKIVVSDLNSQGGAEALSNRLNTIANQISEHSGVEMAESVLSDTLDSITSLCRNTQKIGYRKAAEHLFRRKPQPPRPQVSLSRQGMHLAMMIEARATHKANIEEAKDRKEELLDKIEDENQARQVETHGKISKTKEKPHTSQSIHAAPKTTRPSSGSSQSA